MSDVYLSAAAVIIGQMVFLWIVSIPLKNVSIVDIGWGVGFVLVAWLATPLTVEPLIVLKMLITLWGLRLAWHLWQRNHGKPEDYRYAAMRKKHGASFRWSSLLRVFLLQGVIMWIVALPILAASAESVSDPCWILIGTGCVFWFFGMFWEVVGDWQLAKFKSDPANQGQVLDSGLWKYTRHPNYFGEFVLWWGHWIVCLGVSNYANTWWTIISPMLMTFLLLKVSGVAMLERAMKQRSYKYESYIQQTATFFPRRPKPDVSESQRLSS